MKAFTKTKKKHPKKKFKQLNLSKTRPVEPPPQQQQQPLPLPIQELSRPSLDDLIEQPAPKKTKTPTKTKPEKEEMDLSDLFGPFDGEEGDPTAAIHGYDSAVYSESSDGSQTIELATRLQRYDLHQFSFQNLNIDIYFPYGFDSLFFLSIYIYVCFLFAFPPPSLLICSSPPLFSLPLLSLCLSLSQYRSEDLGRCLFPRQGSCLGRLRRRYQRKNHHRCPFLSSLFFLLPLFLALSIYLSIFLSATASPSSPSFLSRSPSADSQGPRSPTETLSQTRRSSLLPFFAVSLR
jgi:hypothetical protein